jgi:predicted house-cleaning noncanonical NTP pyrophosphatase (MazG superfamily)
MRKSFMGAFQSDDDEGEKPLSYLDKVKNTHNRLKEQHGQGIDLTLEGAEYLQKLQAENEALKQQMQQINEPTYVAQRQALWNVESELREQLEEFYGDKYLDSYEDYERTAVEKIKALRANPDEFMKFLRSQKKQAEFVANVIKQKMPNFNKVPGYQKVDTYSYQDALADLARAEDFAKKGDRLNADKTAKKARSRILEEQMSKTIRM